MNFSKFAREITNCVENTFKYIEMKECGNQVPQITSFWLFLSWTKVKIKSGELPRSCNRSIILVWVSPDCNGRF